MPHCHHCYIFCEWTAPKAPAVNNMKMSLRSFRGNTALSKMAPKLTISFQTKSCMLFSVILGALKTGKMYFRKKNRNFWKYFVVEQNLTRPKVDFCSYLSRPCQILVIWDDRTTANMDPCISKISWT